MRNLSLAGGSGEFAVLMIDEGSFLGQGWDDQSVGTSDGYYILGFLST